MSDMSSNIFLSLVQFSGDALKRMDANLGIHGISFTEYQVLHHLSLSPTSTMPRIELARCVGLTASGVTRLLAPMEKMGMVVKESHPRDARMSLVKLSEAGERIYSESSTTVAHVASGFLDSLSKVQREALARLF